jgi:hypothetical protein
MRQFSADHCLWRCSNCDNEWEARLYSRTRNGTGCQPCGRESAKQKMRTVKTNGSLQEKFPEIAAQFIDNLSNPGRTPDLMNPGTNDRCVWRCAAAHTWLASPITRTKGHGCQKCRGRGISRFEFEVAEIARTGTGLKIEVDARIQILDRSARVDLYIESLDLIIELDPAYWHKNKIDADQRKTQLLSGLNVIRLREWGLPSVPGSCVWVSGHDPEDWGRALLGKLQSRGVAARKLRPAEYSEAMGRAARAWLLVINSRPTPSAADVAPHLIGEFVKNKTRAGLGLEWLTPSARDVCLWKCQCGNEWPARLDNRVYLAQGCPECAYSTSARRRTMAMPENSLLALHPDISTEFVKCVDDPSRSPADLLPASHRRCKWRCSACNTEWETTPALRVGFGIPGTGCPECGAEQRGKSRARAVSGESLAALFPAVAHEFVRCETDQEFTAHDLRPYSNKPCVWKCSDDKTVWVATPASRVRASIDGTIRGCPECKKRRSKQVKPTRGSA